METDFRFLLHEISMSSESGTVAIGEEEYQPQVRKHGSVKHVGLLAKQVARVILMMGLGPTDGILGAAGSFVPGDASEDLQQCAFEPNDPSLQSTSFSWSLIFICFCMILLTGLIYLFHKVYRKIRTDIYVLEPLADKLCNELAETQAEVRRLRVAYDEPNGQQEMLCDSIEIVQWGVIHLGGYTYFETLTPEQRARMYSVERGNLIAARTMGMQQYLNTIRQANRGVDLAAEDTEMALIEGGESEVATNDPEVNLVAPISDYNQVSSTFQSELYEGLMRRSNADVTDFPNLLLEMLDLVNSHQPVPRNLKIQYFTAAADRLQLMANRQPETSQTGRSIPRIQLVFCSTETSK